MPIDSDAASPGPNSPPQTAPSVLAGMNTGDESMTPGSAGPQPGPNEGLSQAMSQVRQIKVGLTEMARQFPSAAAALRQADKALSAAMKQIAANPGTPEPPAPAIGG